MLDLRRTKRQAGSSCKDMSFAAGKAGGSNEQTHPCRTSALASNTSTIAAIMLWLRSLWIWPYGSMISAWFAFSLCSALLFLRSSCRHPGRRSLFLDCAIWEYCAVPRDHGSLSRRVNGIFRELPGEGGFLCHVGRRGSADMLALVSGSFVTASANTPAPAPHSVLSVFVSRPDAISTPLAPAYALLPGFVPVPANSKYRPDPPAPAMPSAEVIELGIAMQAASPPPQFLYEMEPHEFCYRCVWKMEKYPPTEPCVLGGRRYKCAHCSKACQPSGPFSSYARFLGCGLDPHLLHSPRRQGRVCCLGVNIYIAWDRRLFYRASNSCRSS
ncbi:uncharacterized protein BDCG_08209 [Blastomyces dermatitidis ER-3]|uniref:Uncharacterized protein n=1 Tax=Ajellomyces dermatitidis (strain ER-3 / ATCC MYA-2586) TaxID=559297 RepID=A0ABP2ENE4_AJEDR|nr:uncharacterized protein BDCG_08209 [Blastomyces dermatitidis ER-3]EEQ84940.2 hypothetical protein BDCG_08209 [Blastomyces dermatitidis ER-3]